MADYTKTIANRINLIGLEVSTKWGQDNGSPYTMIWGTAKWGQGFTLVLDIEKVLSNSVPLDSTVSKESEKIITNSLGLSEDMFSERLSRENWNYVFPPNTTEGESRISTSWSEPAMSSLSYTCANAGSTIWT